MINALGRDRRRTDALGDVGGGVAGGREAEGEGGVDLEAEVRVVAVLDEDAQALLALVQHRLQPRAAVDGGALRVPAHVGQAARQPSQLVRALRPVLGQVRPRRPHHRGRRQRRREQAAQPPHGAPALPPGKHHGMRVLHGEAPQRLVLSFLIYAKKDSRTNIIVFFCNSCGLVQVGTVDIEIDVD